MVKVGKAIKVSSSGLVRRGQVPRPQRSRTGRRQGSRLAPACEVCGLLAGQTRWQAAQPVIAVPSERPESHADSTRGPGASRRTGRARRPHPTYTDDRARSPPPQSASGARRDNGHGGGGPRARRSARAAPSPPRRRVPELRARPIRRRMQRPGLGPGAAGLLVAVARGPGQHRVGKPARRPAGRSRARREPTSRAPSGWVPGRAERRGTYLPRSCLHCETQACVTVCPSRRVLQARGRRHCAGQPRHLHRLQAVLLGVPYGAREYDYDDGVMKKCTLCVDRIYNETMAPEEPRSGLRARLPDRRAAPRRSRRSGERGARSWSRRPKASICCRSSDTKPVNKYLPPRARRGRAAPSAARELPISAAPGSNVDRFFAWVDETLSR